MVVALVTVAGLAQAATDESIENAWIAPGGRVQVQVGGKTMNLAQEPSQVSARALAISPDRQAVGWLVEAPNCCTSYPIPLTLMLLRPGAKAMRLGANGLAIWGWAFRAGGAQVAFYTGPVHGDYIPNYQLHDVRTGRLIDTWIGREQRQAPEWARGLKPR